jgi:3-dehydroquinate dehydratase-1
MYERESACQRFSGEKEDWLKLQSEKKVKLRNIEFGGDRIRSVVAVIPSGEEELAGQLPVALSSGADAVEIRIVRYPETGELADALSRVPGIKTRETPIILSLNEEGSDYCHTDSQRLELAEDCIREELVDAVDVESICSDRMLGQIRMMADKKGVRLILSELDFLGIASADAIEERAEEMQKKGADMIKLMYLANNDLDLVRAAEAAKQMKTKHAVKVPFCVSTLGDVGLMYRVLADRCGNDFSYSVLKSGAEGMLLETYYQNAELRQMFARN